MEAEQVHSPEGSSAVYEHKDNQRLPTFDACSAQDGTMVCNSTAGNGGGGRSSWSVCSHGSTSESRHRVCTTWTSTLESPGKGLLPEGTLKAWGTGETWGTRDMPYEGASRTSRLQLVLLLRWDSHWGPMIEAKETGLMLYTGRRLAPLP